MKTHGYASRGPKPPTYQSWCDMKRRCLDPLRQGYENYGGRGIKVCERWLFFGNFLQDMGECPKGLTLERIDNNKGYYKDNCKWATRAEQSRNKREYKNSTSGVRGVAKNNCITKGKLYTYWTAWMSQNGKTFRLYHGKDFNEAVRIRKEWEQSLKE
jgi:hypothetical protein